MEKGTLAAYICLVGFFLCVAVHNFGGALFEPVGVAFFFMSLAMALGFLASLAVNLFTYWRRREPADIWKIGFLGVFGVLGFWLSANLYILYGLFGFFGLKK